MLLSLHGAGTTFSLFYCFRVGFPIFSCESKDSNPAIRVLEWLPLAHHPGVQICTGIMMQFIRMSVSILKQRLVPHCRTVRPSLPHIWSNWKCCSGTTCLRRILGVRQGSLTGTCRSIAASKPLYIHGSCSALSTGWPRAALAAYTDLINRPIDVKHEGT